MIKILCYGDSNTYGYDPVSGRYPIEKRWTTILGDILGNTYQVLNEGQNGRTTAFDSYGGHADNGLANLGTCLERNAPVDFIVFMLGTNDCATLLNLSPENIAGGMEQLLLKILQYRDNGETGNLKIVLIAPPAIRNGFEQSPFAFQLDASSVMKSEAIVPLYRRLAEKYACLFLDASDLDVSTNDCEHLTIKGHKVLATRLAPLIKADLLTVISN